MDLKEWTECSTKTWLLHMIDHATRYSGYSGYLKKILVDNGEEFDNQDFRDFCENFNITIKTTAWVGVQQGQSYLMGRSYLFSFDWPPFY